MTFPLAPESASASPDTLLQNGNISARGSGACTPLAPHMLPGGARQDGMYLAYPDIGFALFAFAPPVALFSLLEPRMRDIRVAFAMHKSTTGEAFA